MSAVTGPGATTDPGTARPAPLARVMGPGHTGSDLAVQGAAGLLCAGLIGWYLASSPAGPAWSVWQLVLLAVIAVDLVGGVLTNSTTAAKSWYHRARPGGRRTRLTFVSAHLLHLALVGLVLMDGAWAWLAVSSVLLLSATVLIELAPRPLKLAVATGCYMSVLLLGLLLVPLPEALAWFPALFYLKLLVCFLVPGSEIREA